jgi:heme exporter protein A
MRSPDGDAVACSGLVRRFGERLVLDGLEMRVPAGERVLLTGPNGSGKTTLLRVIATVLRPHGGEVRVWGRPLPSEAKRVRPDIGYVGHEPLIYPTLTVGENLALYASLYGVDVSRIGEVLEQVGLAGRRADAASDLSRGMRQRLALARATLHRPALLLLDEPTAGLDEDGRARLAGLLASHDGSAVIATHEPDWFAEVAGSELRIAAGRAA